MNLKNIPSLAYNLPQDVLCLKYNGDFEQEIELIDALLKRSLPQPLVERLQMEKLLAEGMMKDYETSFDEALAKFEERIEGFTAEELKSYMVQGVIDWRYRRGEIAFQDAFRIVPVMTARCTVRLDERDYPKKLARWQKIAAEAAGQCGRGRIPEVCPPLSFIDAVREAASADLPLFCYEGGEGAETVLLPELMLRKDSIRTAAVVIGPEGGFEPEEASAAVKNGLWPAGLGKRILRTETAAPFVLAALSLRYELTGDRT